MATATITVNAQGVTLIPFTPSNTALFTFSAELIDNSGNSATYIFSTPYNIFGQRFYLTCNDVQGNHQFTVPLVGSPDVYDIPLSAGYFATSVLYRASTNNIEISDVALTGSRPGFNTVGGTLLNPNGIPDLSKISYDLLLDGTWELTGQYALTGKRGANSS